MPAVCGRILSPTLLPRQPKIARPIVKLLQGRDSGGDEEKLRHCLKALLVKTCHDRLITT